VKATFAALLSLKDAGQVAESRSKQVEDLAGGKQHAASGTRNGN
jgi:ribosomal protein S5